MYTLASTLAICLHGLCCLQPLPFLLSETLFSNIGGTATLIGDPPNIIIGNALSHEIGFVDFIKVLMPGVLLMSPFCMLFLKWYFRDTVNGTLKKYEHVLEMKKGYKIRDEKLLHLCLIVLGGACTNAFACEKPPLYRRLV